MAACLHAIIQLDPSVCGQSIGLSCQSEAKPRGDPAAPQHRLRGKRTWQANHMHPGSNFIDAMAYRVDNVRQNVPI
jgi:hypothetical protein